MAKQPVKSPPAKPKAKAKPKKAAPAKAAPKKRGPPPWSPSAEERRLVEHYVSIGMTQEQIAIVMGKSVDSLDRHCRHELDAGALKVNAKIGAKLFDRAMNGDTACLIFWAKTRMGFSEKSRIEHSGPDGGPIPMAHDLTKLSDKDLAELERLAGLIAQPGADPGGEAQKGS